MELALRFLGFKGFRHSNLTKLAFKCVRVEAVHKRLRGHAEPVEHPQRPLVALVAALGVGAHHPHQAQQVARLKLAQHVSLPQPDVD
eukprot:9473676-Pyramimonas_sp.AAC.2